LSKKGLKKCALFPFTLRVSWQTLLHSKAGLGLPLVDFFGKWAGFECQTLLSRVFVFPFALGVLRTFLVSNRCAFSWCRIIALHASQTMAEALLAAGADPNMVEDDYHQTPLHLCATHGHGDIAALMIAKGADAHLKDAWGNSFTDIATAVHTRDKETMERDPLPLFPVEFCFSLQAALASLSLSLSLSFSLSLGVRSAQRR
jgi:hypothetical protein